MLGQTNGWWLGIGGSDSEQYGGPISKTPVDVPGLTSGVARIYLSEHSNTQNSTKIALMENNTAYWWGASNPKDNSMRSYIPTNYNPIPSDIKDMVVGQVYGHCVLRTTGAVDCWNKTTGNLQSVSNFP